MDVAVKFEIPESVRQKVTQCPHDFGCLASGHCGKRQVCAVEYSYGDNVMLLASNEPACCPYRVAFGYSQLCTCAVREYLHAMKHGGIG